MSKPFTFYKQADEMTCGATCLRMIAKYYNKSISLPDIISLTGTTREGTNLLGLSNAAEKIGFRTIGVKTSIKRLSNEVQLPCIAHWNQNHFVVIYQIKKNKIYIADPAHGLLALTVEEFSKNWVIDAKDNGVLLLFETTPAFYNESDEREKEIDTSQNFRFLLTYFLRYRKPIIQLSLGLIAGSFLQLIFPFLTQSIVDIGIQNKDIDFIYLILIAQLMVFLGRTTIEIIRNYILMHISSRINISLVSDFFVKLMKLPISYFDTKRTGDIMQRINDNSRIENFLTGTSLSTLFSLFNFIIYSGILAYYSLSIFLVFLLGTSFYFFWITFFLKQRAKIDFRRFSQSAKNQSKVIELITGMQEIKLHGAEKQKRWQWEALQVKLFKINLKSLSVTTAQNSGSSLINELKNILITFLAAKLVISGQVTLGMMLSISYIIGQLNSPVHEMVMFVQHWQDAKLSLERLNEIHSKVDEEPNNSDLINTVDSNLDFNINGLAFKYEGVGNDYVLKDLTVSIKANQVTAIVGNSGSGKSTFMKLLLKFYDSSNGEINLGKQNLKDISPSAWRDKCGVVMQEGYIFSDTIANNIAVGVDVIDKLKILRAVKIANIKEFIDTLPLGLNTKIGMEGVGISTGQKQRILIARAVYKDPDYLFFDEATSALDTTNEKVIMNNLNDFFVNKTVIVIAHRLSTVKNADQIIVINKGTIVENGKHNELVAKQGVYYELVKNQLELNNC